MLCSGGWSVVNTGPNPSPFFPGLAHLPLPAQTLALGPGLVFLPSSDPQPLTCGRGFTHLGLPSPHWELIPGPSPQSPPSGCSQGMSSASELGKVWERLSKVIPRPSVRHNDLYCGSCVLVGNSKVLRRASGLSNNVTQHTTVFRWVLR